MRWSPFGRYIGIRGFFYNFCFYSPSFPWLRDLKSLDFRLKFQIIICITIPTFGQQRRESTYFRKYTACTPTTHKKKGGGQISPITHSNRRLQREGYKVRIKYKIIWEDDTSDDKNGLTQN